MIRTKTGIIADDFTGANDTGLQFSKNGALTGVFLNLFEIAKTLNDFDVVVVDTESRFDDKNTAYEKVYKAARMFIHGGVYNIYKKLDSTMRGNIGAEIDGAIEGADAKLAIVAPAMPSMGRTTEGGICYINGIAVSETETSNDIKTPITSSDIRTIIAQQSKKITGCISLEEVRSGIELISKKIKSYIEKGIQIIVIDASSDEDLKKIALAASDINERKVYVGSAGFAEQISVVSGIEAFAKQKFDVKVSGGIVIIAGSPSEVTIAQVDYAMRDKNVCVIDVDIDKVLNQPGREKQRIIEQTGGELAEGKDIIIRSAKNRSASQHTEYIGTFLGDVTCDICRKYKPGGLVLTGGDIAIKAINAMGVSGSIVKDEVLSGVASGRFLSDEFRDIVFVTKAGGFGKEDAFLKIIDYFKSL